MTQTSLQFLLVAAIVAAAAVYWQTRNAGFPNPPAALYPPLDQFTAGLVNLPTSSDAATTFAEAANALFATFRDAKSELDAKATTLLGFVGGGSSVIAILAGSDKSLRLELTPLLGLAVVSLVSVLYYCLRCLYPRASPAPNASQFCDVGTISSPSGATRIQSLLGYEYLDAAREIVPIAQSKARRLGRAYIAFAVGVIALVANTVVAAPATTSKPLPVQCTSTAGKTHCTITVEVKP